MSNFKVEIKGLDAVAKKLKDFPAEIENKLQERLADFARNTASDAKQNLTANGTTNEGFLVNSIQPDIKKLSVSVVVSANYAAYVEFGTRKYAAQYVSSLPADWQTFAAKFRGAAGGTFAEFIQRLVEWIHHRGLGSGFGGKVGVAGTYSVKTRKRTGSKQTQEAQDKQAAYVIARKILRNGIRPQPFLFPAFEKNKIELENNLKADFGQ